MLKSFLTASSGVLTAQKGMEVVSNNLSNLDSAGYKADKASFADLMHSSIKAAASAEGKSVSSGNGVKLSDTVTDFSQGPLQQTGYKNDYAIFGDGFFAVQDENGTHYTRDGSFRLSSAQGKNGFYLVDAKGGFVLDEKGQRIFSESGQNVTAPGVFRFFNKEGLLKKDGNSFYETELSGKAEAALKPDCRAGYIESSASDVAEELSEAIMLQRSFALNAKMAQTSDEVMQTLNNLR
ncbi:MAG: flagellar hook-basal body protein [Bacillota bacterium]|nr:flagellar hook-basal body protein [Bacillota bacterium]